MNTTTEKSFRFDWMKAGAEFTENNHKKFEEWLADLDSNRIAYAGFDHWHAVADRPSLPFSQGQAINTAIKELRLPKVSHFAYSSMCDPYGVVAIRAHFKNGRVDLVLMDTGCELVSLCTRVWNPESQPDNRQS